MTTLSLSDSPREELLASGLRRELDLGRGHIDPFDVARRLGLEVVLYPVESGGVEGQYRPIENGPGAIFVNSRTSTLRQRFTAAHEIGHALLHTRQAIVDETLETRASTLRERQADRFAGALLIDRGAAEEVLRRHQGDIDPAIAEIVDTFEVSVPTAAIALTQFRLLPGSTCHDFLRRYDGSHADFMRRHGRKSRHRDGRRSLTLDERYRARVIAALAAGQLDEAQASAYLGIEPSDLPAAAVESRRRLIASLADAPDFEA